MNFSHIDSRLTSAQVQAGKSRMAWLLTELAIRDDNQHVGTGLGGNNFQFLTLMNLKHNLVKRDVEIYVGDNFIAWGVPWFLRSTKTAIRLKLDEVFNQIVEKNKVVCLALAALANAHYLRSALYEHKEHFPELSKSLDSKTYVHNPALSSLEQLIAACVLCQELARSLDNGDITPIPITGLALMDFPPDILLYSIRRHIQIDRLVKFNLDEDKVFLKVLKKVNDVVL
jgi:hypothetical protein